MQKQKAKNKMQDARCKMQNVWLLTFCFWLLVSLVFTHVYAANKPITRGDEPIVVEHVIKVEGSVEKPRVIFIIPRSKLWRDDIFRKSFIVDILRPIYPKLSINEEGSDRNLRR